MLPLVSQYIYLVLFIHLPELIKLAETVLQARWNSALI